jgi:uncharacterized protein YdhG (YjbR/CyaY superfamily)
MDKDRPEYKTPDEYIARFSGDVKKKLQAIRKLVSKLVPEATERISYGMPSFTLNGNLVYYAAFKDHIGFFPTASGVAAFEDKLAKYNHSKGTIQFPFDEPLPTALITKIVKFRVAENRKKKKK